MLARASVNHIDDSVPRPVVVGTDIKVSMIAREVEQMQMSPHEVVEAHPHLSLADVHAALAYFYDHREAIEDEWHRADALVQELQAQYPPRQA